MAYGSPQSMGVRPVRKRKMYQESPLDSIRANYGLATQMVKENKAKEQAERIRQEDVAFRDKQFAEGQRQASEQAGFAKRQSKSALGFKVGEMAMASKKLGGMTAPKGIPGIGGMSVGSMLGGAGIGYGLATAFGAKKSWQRGAAALVGGLLGGMGS